MGHDYCVCTECEEVFYNDGSYCDICYRVVCPECLLKRCTICSCEHKFTEVQYYEFDDGDADHPVEHQLSFFKPNSTCGMCKCTNHICVALSVCKTCRKGQNPTDGKVKAELVRLSGLTTTELAAKLGVDMKVAVENHTIPPQYKEFTRHCKVCNTKLQQDELHADFRASQSVGLKLVEGQVSCRTCARRAGVSQAATTLIPDLVNLIIKYDKPHVKRKRKASPKRKHKRRKVIPDIITR